MIIRTVGELIGFLQKFPEDTPVLKGMPSLAGYNDIQELPNMLYKVKHSSTRPENTDYVDSDGDKSEWQALVL